MHPTAQDLTAIQALYKQAFAFDDGGSIDHYFQHHFALETCWIHREQKEIAAMLCAHPHQMMLHHTYLPVLFISGVITKEGYRRQGYMKQLFQTLFSQTQEAYALYVLQAYDPQIYLSLGFHPQYYHKEVLYQGKCLPSHLQPITNALDCVYCAQKELESWEGWMDHDIKFYENELSEAQAQGQSILGYYENNTCTAFARIAPSSTGIHIEECLAVNDVCKQQLFEQLASLASTLTYSVPTLQSDPNASCNLMVKAGNLNLCLSDTQKPVSSLTDLFSSSQAYYHYGWW